MRFRKLVTKLILIVVVLFHQWAFSQTTPSWCDFWGNATYWGRDIVATDTIKAYTKEGKLCGEATGFSGSPYGIRVYGIYENSPYYPDGASEGDTITFRINGGPAVIISGDNVWSSLSIKKCDIEVLPLPPKADPGGPYTGFEGNPVSFDGSGSVGISYEWNFGDGTAHSSNMKPVHTYIDNGVYTVTLMVVNSKGQTDTKTTTATISNVSPTAEAGGPYSGVINQPVQFNGSATDLGINDVFTYMWDLDDDGVYDDYTGQNPTKIYSEPGLYTIWLKVTDNDGGWGVDSATVNITQGTKVTVRTFPDTTLEIIVNGQTFSSPHTFFSLPGSEVSLEAPLYQSKTSGIRYYYWKWSDGGERSHTITVSSSPIVITANYQVQYLLTVDDGGKGGNPTGGGWYFSGTSVPISVDSLIIDSFGTTRYTFVRWEGKGPGSYSGDSLSAHVRMDSAITETVVWKTDYWLQLSGVNPDTLSGWYSADTLLVLTVPNLIWQAKDERLRFVRWIGEGSGSYTGYDTSITITMHGPITETVQWKPQYYLTVTSFPPYGGKVRLSPSGPWYDDSTKVWLKAVPQNNDIVFVNWSGDLSGDTNPTTIRMNKPKTIVAHFSSTSNFPPHILSIPDTTIFEDQILFLPCSKYVSDLNDPFDSLKFAIENSSHFSVAFDTSNEWLMFIPDTNWYGIGKVIFSVTDPWGLSAVDTFTVEVLSVNDPPGPFQLLAPANGTVIPDSVDWITFIWQQSVNVDSGDAIKYEFSIAKDSLLSPGEILFVNNTSDTALTLIRDGIEGELYWGVRAVDSFDSSRWSTPKSFKISVLTGIESRNRIPKHFVLYQNYPNPFNPETTIKYLLPRSSKVKLEVWDILGHVVRTLVDGNVEAGIHEIVWDGRNEKNEPLSSGIYFIRIKAGNFVRQRKIILVR